MAMPEDNEPDYRAGVNIPVAKEVSPVDEQDFSTLLYIQSGLNKEMRKLNSIDVFELDNGQISVENQIIAYKKAKEILEPFQALVNDTVTKVRSKQSGDQ